MPASSNDKSPDKSPKPKGHALNRTPAQLEADSEVSAEDIMHALTLVDKHGSELLRGLWRAKRVRRA